MNDFRDLDAGEFEIARRGYDRGQVDAHLSELRTELARLEQLVKEPGDIPGDGTFPEPVQAELDSVSSEVEAIVGAAREAAEGLRTRAAAEASRWREEASTDARRWRSEAEEASSRLRADAETAADRMVAEAQEESTKRRSDADAHVARVREEADAYAHQTRQVAESEASQLTEEADAYSSQARTAADAYATQTRETAEAEATSMRTDARDDAATWRSEAQTEATRVREEADTYAEQLTAEVQAAAEATQAAAESYASTLRSSAEAESLRQRTEAQSAAETARASVWDEATAILQTVAREIREARERGESEALAIIAEAEQQSHRLVSQARQSTEEQRRAARIEADRLVGDAQAQHDEIIEAANRAAASAQERAQALERRREELMGQLEKAQQAMRTMEEELENRRETLRDRDPLTDSSTVKIVPQTEPEERDGVRVIPPPDAPSVTPIAEVPVTAEEIMDEVRALREQRESAQVEPEAATPEAEPVTAAAPTGDIDALFANLRDGESEAPVGRQPSVDPDDLRERLLLPAQNRAHRLIKKELTEQQNLTLEQLRVAGDDWVPDANDHADALGPAIAELVLESARSGYLAAVELGIRSDSPPDIVADNADTQVAGFASDLTDAVAQVLDTSRSAGETSRKTSAAASRVYRAWRTDSAELRLREISDVAYADALRTALRLEGIEDTEWALGDWAAARHAS